MIGNFPPNTYRITMAQTLNATANTFTPGVPEHHPVESLLEMGEAGVQNFITEIQTYINTNYSTMEPPPIEELVATQQAEYEASEQAEYEDGFLEYAYENGLWGLPGSNYEPSENEFTEMRQQFAEHYININGYSDTLDYGLNIENDDEDDVTDDEYENENEQENDGGDNGTVEDGEPETWEDIAVDFQDFVDYRQLIENMDEADYSELDNAWDIYLETHYHPAARNWITQLGIASNWVGIYSEEQLRIREIDYNDGYGYYQQ